MVQFYKYLPDHNHWKKDTDVNPSVDDGSFSFKFGRTLEGRKSVEAAEGEISEKHRTTKRRIKVKDSQIGVLGDRAKVEGGINFNEKTGGIHVSDITGDVAIHAAESTTGAAEAVREAYLNRVISDAGFLALKGIDPKAASITTSSRLNLKAVYTALLTRRADLNDRSMQIKSEKQEPLSALTLLDRHRHLVLLGDPGSGKSTFVNFVSLCLTGESLGRKDASIELLTAPLPDEEGQDSAERQPWRHGPLLPLRITLRDFVAWGLPDQKSQDVVSEDLWRFIEAELTKAAIGEYAPYLKDELMQKGGLVFFDGLDEVPVTDDRRVQIKQAVEDFAASFHNCRILVTSRTYAYQQQNWQIAIPGITEAVLAPFSRGQIHRFVHNWYVHVAELDARNQEDALGDAELLRRVIFNSASLMDLAKRPLLLTLIASLHAWRGGSFPENREELYADALELLLDLWESPKIVKDSHGAYKLIQPSLMEWLNVRDRKKIRRFLNELAYNVHQRQENPADTADITGDELVAGLLKLNPDPDLKPARLVEYLSERAGVIVPRGVGVYTFLR